VTRTAFGGTYPAIRRTRYPAKLACDRQATAGVLVADSEQIIDQINQTAASGSSAPPAGGSAAAAAGAAMGAAGTFMQGLTAGATSMANGAQQMLASAQSGQLKFDPETGQSLINTLNTHIGDLNASTFHLTNISNETKLGTTVGGKAMTQFNQQVAVNGSQAFVPAHEQFVQSLQTAVQAIQKAMDNYTSTEGDNAHKLTAQG
jgi:hypothetical protein